MKPIYWILAIFAFLWFYSKQNYCATGGCTTNVSPDVTRYGDRNNFDVPVSMPGSGQAVVQAGGGSGSISIISDLPYPVINPFGFAS